MTDSSTDLRWGVERRLEFIEFRLYWDGRINRKDIIEFFDVSVPQASKDLSLYQEIVPDNMVYDKREKRYLTSKHFYPHFLTPNPDRYLSLLRLVSERITPVEETWIANLPNVDCIPLPHRRVKPEVLRSVLTAIRDKRAVEVQYQSMNPKRPDPIWRGISPHALASDGLRWHIRAFCHIEDKFKDFLLSRCLDINIGDGARMEADADQLWNEFFEVALRPNPHLSESQQRTIADDYDMVDGSITLPIRKSLLYYFQKRMRFDVASALDNPNEIPVVIANREDFDRALAQAMA